MLISETNFTENTAVVGGAIAFNDMGAYQNILVVI
jgi:predicted outer membrane repeat protein